MAAPRVRDAVLAAPRLWSRTPPQFYVVSRARLDNAVAGGAAAMLRGGQCQRARRPQREYHVGPAGACGTTLILEERSDTLHGKCGTVAAMQCRVRAARAVDR